MYYNGYAIHLEVIMGEVHCTLRARRFDDCTGHSWDHLYRGVSPVDSTGEDLDTLFTALSRLLEDLAFAVDARNDGLGGSHQA